jgi:hypothetical protein
VSARGARARPSSRELDHVSLDRWDSDQGVANGCTVVCSKEVVEFLWVCGRRQQQRSDHLDLCWPLEARVVDGFTKTLNTFVQWYRDFLSESASPGLLQPFA